jgi:kynureninase
LRFGFAPLYTRFVDVHTGMARLRDIMTTAAWEDFPAARSRVT